MERDVGWKGYLSDDERYADVINGIACGGRQVVKKSDLQEMDTQTGFLHGPRFVWKLSPRKRSGKVKIRDTVRKAAFGMNFAIIGIENQEMIDYSIPLRNMAYDVGEYEKQAAKIRKAVRKEHSGLSRGEYLYGFGKNSKLYPVVTFILYSGEETWDGAKTLHEMLDFTDIPKHLQEMAQDYRINLIEIRKFEDTSVFKTDVRQVFDFIRCSEDKNALKELMEGDAYYQNMEEDAFDVVVQYANATELVGLKEHYRKEGKVDMCRAITEWIAEEREAGMQAGREAGLQAGRVEGIEEKTRTIVTNMLKRGMPDADIRALAECEQKLIDEVKRELDRK